jgi:hypothetical protein
VRRKISKKLGPELKYIVDVAQGGPGGKHAMNLSERDLRVIRFCLDRSLESI